MATVPFPRPIRIGTVGRDVLAVKSVLHRLGYGPTMSLKDPTWGKGSASALAQYLRVHGYPHADGNYGPKAHASLSPHMNLYERGLERAVYNKLHKPKVSLSTRQQVVRNAKLVYDHRFAHYYTQDSRRWQGIDLNLKYPHYPTYSDCSSFATWCYWNAIGNGPDILNGAHWRAGFTGTLTSHGRAVSIANLRPGDLVFYGTPVNHVAIYVGNGRVISHGHDPVGLYPVYYRSVNHARSYV